jgi:hypothetical protein
MRSTTLPALALLAAAAVAACHSDPSDLPHARQAVVYGADDRQEVFELQDPALRERVERSVVAIVPRALLVEHDDHIELTAPSRIAQDGACDDEPFAAQPAAALCSGVLVDWNLVLTAGHCIRVPRLDDYVVVLGYYYRAPGELALAPGDVFELAEVVAEASEREDGRTTLDYAFVRLDRRAGPQSEPAPIRTAVETIAQGASVLAAGASESVPLKVDRGGTVQRTRPQERDYFVADTDTAKGGSGGAAFDAELALLGVLSLGSEDWVDDGGCLRARRASGEEADEHYSYAGRALADLCARRPEVTTLCRADCGEPCRALPPSARSAGGCASASAKGADQAAGSSWIGLSWTALALAYAARRANATPRRSP